MTTGNHEGEVGMTSQRVSGTAVQRTIAVLGSAVFFVVAPCTLAGLLPWCITGLELPPPVLGLAPARRLRAVMIFPGGARVRVAFFPFTLLGLFAPPPLTPP